MTTEDPHGRPPEPGDLFVLAATADLPVEWAILERSGEDSGRLLAVPADTCPLAGSADVEVAAGDPGGPLCLRCRFGAWLDAGLFPPGMRSGALAPETVAEALQLVRRIEAGNLAPSPLAEEVDAEPEYVDWIRDVSEPARTLALAVRQPAARQRRSGLLAGYRLAATFALVAIGLAVWVALLRRDVERLSAPIFAPPSQEVAFGGNVRGRDIVLEVPRQASHVLLILVLEPTIEEQEGRFEIADAAGRLVWHGSDVHLTPAGEFPLVVPRAYLPDGKYQIRLVPTAGGSALADNRLEVVTGK
jgi:hypothetical protein